MGKFSDIPYFLLKEYIQLTRAVKADPTPGEWNPTLAMFYNYVEDTIEHLLLSFHINGIFTQAEWDSIFENKKGAYFTDTDAVMWNTYSNQSTTSAVSGSYLMGKGHTIVTKADLPLELYIKDPDYGFRQIRLTPLGIEPIDRQYFPFSENMKLNVTPGTSASNIDEGLRFRFIDYDYQTDNQGFIESGWEVYFRKDSFFHKWLQNYATTHFEDKWDQTFDIRNYVNTDKTFIYFGNIYPSSISASEGQVGQNWNILFTGMKDYTLQALPPNNRNTNLQEFLEVYFDRVHQEIYNLQKNVWTMKDPMECDMRFIGYMAKFYDVSVDEYPILEEQRQREFTRDLIHLLKRKGTYVSVMVLWKLLSRSQKDFCTIYERWHPHTASGQLQESDYTDYIYQGYYSDIYPLNLATRYIYAGSNTIPLTASPGIITKGAGSSYYGEYDISNYPTSYESTGNVLSTAYRVEGDITEEPLGSDTIFSENIATNLYRLWEMIRPINRVTSYNIVISPLTDLTSREIPLYLSGDYRDHMTTKLVAEQVTTKNCAIGTNEDPNSSTWTISHTLNTKDILTICMNEKFEELIPDSITFPTNDTVVVQLKEPTRGILLMVASNISMSKTPEEGETVWRIRHSLAQKEVMLQLHSSGREKFYPDYIELLDINTAETEISSDTGFALATIPDFVFIQSVSSNIWNITHNFGHRGVMVECYDANNDKIKADTIVFTNETYCTVTFNKNVSGYAVVKDVGSPVFSEAIFKRDIDGNVLTPLYKVGSSQDKFDTGLLDSGTAVSATEDDYFYYFTVKMSDGVEGEIREVALYDRSYNMITYTKCYPIYKIPEIGMNFHFRVSKEPLENIDAYA